MPKVLLVRHGQSIWNLENRFAGWTDVQLTDLGREQARDRANELLGTGVSYIFTSRLVRAYESARIMQNVLRVPDENFFQSDFLKERYYGELQGVNRDEAVSAFGVDQVRHWRRGFHACPPGGESLQEVLSRVRTYWRAVIEPIAKRHDVLIVAHGNVNRALSKELMGLSDTEVESLEFSPGEVVRIDYPHQK